MQYHYVNRKEIKSLDRAVQFVVSYGLANRDMENINEIGIDEIQVWLGHKYLTGVS